MKATLPANYFVVVGADPLYQRWLKEDAEPDLKTLNAAWGTQPSLLQRCSAYGAAGRQCRGSAKTGKSLSARSLPFRDTPRRPVGLSRVSGVFAAAIQDRIADYNKDYTRPCGVVRSRSRCPTRKRFPPAGPPLIDWIAFLRVAPL